MARLALSTYLTRKDVDLNPDLEYFRVNEVDGNRELARVCFYYLQENAFAWWLKNYTEANEAFPLLIYAGKHWHKRAQGLDRSEDVFNLSQPLHAKNSSVREIWLRTLAETSSALLHKSTPLLHITAATDVLQLAQNILWRKGWRRAMRSHHVTQKVFTGRTALHVAASHGSEAMVRLLLVTGASVKAKDNEDLTPLWVSAFKGQLSISRLLLEHGAEIDSRNNDQKTPLHASIIYSQGEVTRLLIDWGADTDLKDRLQENALLLAARKGLEERYIRLLLENGADIKSKNQNGESALMLAAWFGRITLIRLLLERGAFAKEQNHCGEDALFFAAVWGHNTAIQLLLGYGASINTMSNNGQTALWIASARGNTYTVWLLLENGASSIDAKDRNGHSALLQASVKGYTSIVQLLFEYGASTDAENSASLQVAA